VRLDRGLGPNVLTITFHVLYVFLVLAHDRRRVIHFNVTAYPTAEWASQQLVQAFPWDIAPRYLWRDRDTIYGERVRRQLKDMAVKENPYCTSMPLTISLCRTLDRIHPTRMSQPDLMIVFVHFSISFAMAA
jgi:hypothetical protein